MGVEIRNWDNVRIGLHTRRKVCASGLYFGGMENNESGVSKTMLAFPPTQLFL